MSLTNDDEVGLLSWLQTIANDNRPVQEGPALIPVAWIGQTSTEDKQDPTLSLPRQLDKARSALPPPLVIVAHFYDVESGRTELASAVRATRTRSSTFRSRATAASPTLSRRPTAPIAGSSPLCASRSNASPG